MRNKSRAAAFGHRGEPDNKIVIRGNVSAATHQYGRRWRRVGREQVGQDHAKRAQERRKLASSIRKYAAWLDERTKSDLLTYAASIDAEAERLERADSENEVRG